MTTQVVILAAGMGSRLGRSLPKPLTELSDGRTIMKQQFDNIHHAFGNNVKVTIVVGYKLEHIIEASVKGGVGNRLIARPVVRQRQHRQGVRRRSQVHN